MFLEISSSTYQSLDVLRHKGPIDATAAVAEIAATVAPAERHAFVSNCRHLLADLAQRAVIGAIQKMGAASLGVTKKCDVTWVVEPFERKAMQDLLRAILQMTQILEPS